MEEGRHDTNARHRQDGYPAGAAPPVPPGPPAGVPGLSPILLVLALALAAIAVLVGGGILINQLFVTEKQQSAADFKLKRSPSYREALVYIRNNFFGDYSESEITEAAQRAVEKAKKQGGKTASQLEDIGLKALLKALDDDHTEYLDPRENKMLNESLKGTFFGVGFTLRRDKEEKRPKVVSIIKGSPSDRAGIKKDDVIMSVDGKDTRGMALDAVVSRIRGKGGTRVRLVIKRPDTGKTRTYTLTRERIDIPDLDSEILDGRYGLLRTYNFSRGIGDKVRAEVSRMRDAGVRGFILDLRNDPGGLLDEAVRVSSVFMDEGVVVSYQRRGQGKVEAKASGGAETDLPLVVLINGGSASSSEITAGALKDRGRAVLVGSKSYGKGSIQKVYELDNEGAAKLTIAKYFLPNGESIDGKGIIPDVTVEVKDDVEKEEQLQLDKAKEVLEGLIKGKPQAYETLPPAA